MDKVVKIIIAVKVIKLVKIVKVIKVIKVINVTDKYLIFLARCSPTAKFNRILKESKLHCTFLESYASFHGRPIWTFRAALHLDCNELNKIKISQSGCSELKNNYEKKNYDIYSLFKLYFIMEKQVLKVICEVHFAKTKKLM